MVIYEPRGRAREYAALAANLYNGCSHGCRYCYAPACLHRLPETFHTQVSARPGVYEQLTREAPQFRGNQDPILLCFTCDPYQPIDGGLQLTRRVVELFLRHDVRFSILTKGGMRAARDFDLLQKGRSEFGTTLCFLNDRDREHWEPAAAPIGDRIKAIQTAHEMGIFTYVSVEPVIDVQQAIDLIAAIHPIVDFWKIGKLNHLPLARQIDWSTCLAQVTDTLNKIGGRFYVKKDLMRYRSSSTNGEEPM